VFETEAEAEAEMARLGGPTYKVGGTFESGYGNFDRLTNEVVQF